MLEQRDADIKHVRSVRKEPFRDSEIGELLRGVSAVIIAKGKKSTKFVAGDVKPADLKGPTGNYRSPIVRRGKTLLVGFNQEALERIL